jgi:mRNA interferase MazF
MPNPKVGEIWYVNFDPQVGTEQGGKRPALVVSVDRFNAMGHQLRLVVPLTSRIRGFNHHIAINPPEGGLVRPSVAMCEQIKAQNLARFDNVLGVVAPGTLETIQETIGLILNRRPARRTP